MTKLLLKKGNTELYLLKNRIVGFSKIFGKIKGSNYEYITDSLSGVVKEAKNDLFTTFKEKTII